VKRPFLRWLFGARADVAHRRRTAFLHGMQVMLPAVSATLVWGLVTGVAMVKTGLAPHLAAGMSLAVFAGSAQLAALPLIAAAAPVWVILLTAFAVNLRFVIFSAGLYPYFRYLPLPKRLLLGYVTTDLGFSLSLPRWLAQADADPGHPRGSPEQTWFFLGLAFPNWTAWQAGSLAGIFLADRFPDQWGVGFAAILALIGILVPMLAGAPALAGALAAGVVAIAAHGLPLKLGLVAAVVAGMAVAMTVDVALDRRRGAA
jgi:predicted branched-subunit amino acid permease